MMNINKHITSNYNPIVIGMIRENTKKSLIGFKELTIKRQSTKTIAEYLISLFILPKDTKIQELTSKICIVKDERQEYQEIPAISVYQVGHDEYILQFKLQSIYPLNLAKISQLEKQLGEQI